MAKVFNINIVNQFMIQNQQFGRSAIVYTNESMTLLVRPAKAIECVCHFIRPTATKNTNIYRYNLLISYIGFVSSTADFG